MKNLLQTTIVAGLLVGTISVQAGERFCPKGNEAYVVDSRGNVVLDGSGNCVRSSSWTKELAIKECDPDLFPASEPVAAPAPVPAPAPAPAPMQVKKTKTLGAGALFALNKSSLSDAGKAELDALAAGLAQMDEVNSVKVVGHTDSTGAASYNQSLSVKRAETVKAYLVSKGVDPALISASGMGESQPVADNSTREGRAKNRRVEITIDGSVLVVQ